MGGIPSIPRGEIEDIAKEAMKTFTPEYIKAFGVELIKEMQRDREGDSGETMHLRTEPLASEPLKMGWLEKQGAVKKNWKKRWFIAANAADEYFVYYYEKQTDQLDTKSAKGKMRLCGYRVMKNVSDEDKEKYGENSVQIYPTWYGRRRRTWYLRAETEEELDEWMSVLKLCCQRADPPINKDPVLREAFRNAFQKTRWALWVWGWYSFVLAEDELLAQMVVDKCNREVMQPVYAKCTGRMAHVAREKVEDALDKTVGAVVGAGWQSASKGIESAKPKVKETAENQIGEILNKRQELMDKISGSVSEKANPVVEEVVSPVLKPLVEALVYPLFNAQKKSIEIFKEKMAEVLEKDAESYEKELNRFSRRCRGSYGDLRKAFECIHALTRYDSKTSVGDIKLSVPIGDIIEMLGDVSLWRVEDELEDVVRQLIQNAIYTYKAHVEEETHPHGQANLDDILDKLVHDSKIMGNRTMANLLFDVVGEKVKSKVIPAIGEITNPVKEMIPDAFQQLLDVDEMAESIVNKVLMGFMHSTLDPTSDPIYSDLDQLSPSGGKSTPSIPKKVEDKKDDKTDEKENKTDDKDKKADDAAPEAANTASGDYQTKEEGATENGTTEKTE